MYKSHLSVILPSGVKNTSSVRQPSLQRYPPHGVQPLNSKKVLKELARGYSVKNTSSVRHPKPSTLFAARIKGSSIVKKLVRNSPKCHPPIWCQEHVECETTQPSKIVKVIDKSDRGVQLSTQKTYLKNWLVGIVSRTRRV